MSQSQATLQTLLESQPNWLVEAEDHCLCISNDEGLDVFVYAGEQQILVEAPLFSAASVTDFNALNALVLRTHHILPLTGICIKTIGDDDYYVAFGALSTQSKESVILEEVETLFANIDEFLELYSVHLNSETVL